MNLAVLQPGDFILFSGKSFVSRGIKVFTNSKWSHVAFYYGNGMISEATETGVEMNELEPLLKKASAIAVMRVPGLTVEELKKMQDKSDALLGDGYDYLQLLVLAPYFLFRKIGWTFSFLLTIFDMGGKEVCSAFCAMLLLVINRKLSKVLNSVTPETFYSSGSLIKAYEEELIQ